LIVGINCTRLKHLGRYVTAPNGKRYQITQIIDANTIIIDTEYSGATVTTTNGKFQIDADEYYADRPQAGIDAGWDADDASMSVIDANGGSFYIYFNGDNYYEIYGFDLTGSINANGIIKTADLKMLLLQGCLMTQAASQNLLNLDDSAVFFDRCVCVGNEVGIQQRFISADCSHVEITNSAIYAFGDNGMRINRGSTLSMENANIGVEIANGDHDIFVTDAYIKSRNVKLGGTNGEVLFADSSPKQSVTFEDFGKVLGVNKTFYDGGEYVSIAVAGETPNKKLSDIVLKVTPNVDNVALTKEMRYRIPLSLINAKENTLTWGWWLYNELGKTINVGDPELEIYLEIEYVNSYNDVTAYTKIKATSTQQDVIDAVDADDWQLFSVTLVNAVESILRCNLVVSIYSVNSFFIDPMAVKG